MTTTSSLSFSALQHRKSGYISSSFPEKTKGHTHLLVKFWNGSTAARQVCILHGKNNSVGGYTVNKNQRIRTIILPTLILQEKPAGSETPIYVGTSSNVASVAAVISIPQECLTCSVRFLVDVMDAADMTTLCVLSMKNKLEIL